MALSDLAKRIESFDYNRVGDDSFRNSSVIESLGRQPVAGLGSDRNPQSFEEYPGGLVTGNQSFDRPLQEPLPIQEVFIGYGLRSLLSRPQGFNFFEDTFANGFTTEILPDGANGPGPTQFNFLSEEDSSFNNSISFIDNDFTFGTQYSFFADVPIMSFNNRNRENVNIQSETLEIPVHNEGTMGSSKTYTFGDSMNAFAANEESIHSVGFTKNMTTTQFKGIEDSSYTPTSNTFSTEYADTLESITFPESLNVLNQSTVFQTNLNVNSFNDSFHGLGNLQFRRQNGRIVEWNNTPSNFTEQTNTSDDSTLNLDYLTSHTITIPGQGPSLGSQILMNAGRGIMYPERYTSYAIPNQDGSVFSEFISPNRLEQFGIDVLQKENRTLLLPVNNDGTPIDSRLELSGENQGRDGILDTYTNYIQGMSPGDSQPFIVRKMGNDWGLESIQNLELGPSVAQNVLELASDALGFLDNLGGGIVRGAPTFSGRLSREFSDIVRRGKFLLTGDGLIFGIKQVGLQLNNKTIESRVWNPLSMFSNDFVHIKRHLGGLEYESLMEDPVEAVKKAVPAFVEPFVSPILKKIFPGMGDGNATSRTALQIDWVAPKQDTPDESGGLFAKLGNMISGKINDAKLTLHNPNHYTRLRIGPLDPYGGPNAGASPIKEAETLKEQLEGGTHGKTKTFVTEPDKIPGNQKVSRVMGFGQGKFSHIFKTYGEIREAASDDRSRNIYEEKFRQIPVNPQAAEGIEDGDESEAEHLKDIEFSEGLKEWRKNTDIQRKGFKLQEKYYEEVSDKKPFKGVRDRANATPILPETANPNGTDFIDFYFKTTQWNESTPSVRYLQFSAIINTINESVTPEYSEQRYLGRPDKYYVYNGVDRDITMSITLYPNSIDEFPFLMEKLNYLVGLCYPQYSTAGHMIAPNVDMTVGDMFREQPGYLTSLAINVQENTTWELDLFQFPKHITADFTFRYYGKHVPHQFGKHYDIPYLAPYSAADVSNRQHVGSTVTPKATYDANKDSGAIVSLVRRGSGEKVTDVQVDNLNIQSNEFEQKGL